ncbi:MAG: methylmalonyl-CoA mutase family protein, partial [Dehalococcoidia bacterium]|nr:methylmalonyl-CoA mutase family protein [Dehalococcoidia bacterium]
MAEARPTPKESTRDQDRRTTSGIPLKAVYSPEDLGDMDRQKETPLPGQYPYTRGLYPTGYRKFSWMKRELSGYGLPEETN